MSKYVKNLVVEDIRGRLSSVHDALLVNMIGLDANANWRLRSDLRSKKINVLVVKNSLAARAMADTPLAGMFAGVSGCAAICWGSEDIVSLAKEVTRVLTGGQYAAFQARGGIMDGQQLSPDQVVAVAKWPSRAEQLSILVGQILSPGAKLVSQFTAIGGALASQISQRGEGEEPEASGTPASSEGGPPPEMVAAAAPAAATQGPPQE
jgi:large subunit ribosomal protein L10